MIRTLFLKIAILLIALCSKDLFACSYLPLSYTFSKDELITKARIIALVEVKKQIESEDGMRNYFEPIEFIKGADFDVTSYRSRGQHHSNDFNYHQDAKFWEKEIGRVSRHWCGVDDFPFVKGEQYLLFPDAMDGSPMAAEIIKSKEDKWYQYVKDKVMEQRTKVDKSALGYTRIDFPDAAGTSPQDINDAGLVVGYYMSFNATQHGFLWDGGKYQSIDFPDAVATVAHAVNGTGLVVGSYQDQDNRTHGFLWDGNEYKTMDYPNANYTIVRGINDAGTIVGEYEDGEQTSDCNNIYGFSWDGSEYTRITVPNSWDTFALGFNNEGIVVGIYHDDDGDRRSFSWNGKEYKTIDYPDASETHAYEITDAGVVVGSYISSDDGQFHGFSWNGKKYKTIDFPDAINTVVTSGNDSGAVVGVNNSLSTGFLYHVE